MAAPNDMNNCVKKMLFAFDWKPNSVKGLYVCFETKLGKNLGFYKLIFKIKNKIFDFTKCSGPIQNLFPNMPLARGCLATEVTLQPPKNSSAPTVVVGQSGIDRIK